MRFEPLFVTVLQNYFILRIIASDITYASAACFPVMSYHFVIALWFTFATVVFFKNNF